MKKIIHLIFLVLMIPLSTTYASSGGYPLDSIEPNVGDQPSLQRGLGYFMNYCYGCHTTQFQRYERVANDLGIPSDLMEQYVIHNQSKLGDLMETGVRKNEIKQWFGATPPDLTLVSRVRGPAWLYTYLRTFYIDPSRPWGVNNKVFPDVGMPHALLELQGGMIDTCGEDELPTKRDTLTGELLCGLVPDSDLKGAMTPAQFDQAVYDLVNFLAYSGEPMQVERQTLGIYVLLFLVVFFIFAYFLKKEYWRDVKSGCWRDAS